jgi:hypothetical protein
VSGKVPKEGLGRELVALDGADEGELGGELGGEVEDDGEGVDLDMISCWVALVLIGSVVLLEKCRDNKTANVATIKPRAIIAAIRYHFFLELDILLVLVRLELALLPCILGFFALTFTRRFLLSEA